MPTVYERTRGDTSRQRLNRFHSAYAEIRIVLGRVKAAGQYLTGIVMGYKSKLLLPAGPAISCCHRFSDWVECLAYLLGVLADLECLHDLHHADHD
jgi:hypothetical protein